VRVLAVIPARGGSKRLPGKNIRPLQGKPLIAWSIDFARALDWVNEVHVSTDSPEIAEVAAASSLPVPRLRPATLATDEAGSVEVVLDTLAWYASQDRHFDAVALLQPTTPVRLAQRWDQARDLLESPACDGVIGIAPARTHPYLVFRRDALGTLSRWDMSGATVTRAQDMPPAYEVNGALYLVKVQALREERSFFPTHCKGVTCDQAIENIDIDTPDDWRRAEALIQEWTAQNS